MFKNTNRKSLMLVLALVCAFVVSLGATYAWFTDTKSGAGTVAFGQIKIDLQYNGTGMTANSFAVTNVMPGDTILSGGIVVKKDANSSNYYLRAKIAFSSTETGVSDFVTALNGLISLDGWVKSGDYYYYGTASALTEATGDVYLVPAAGLIVPTTLTQASGNAQYGKTITLNVEVEAVQSAHTGTTPATWSTNS